MAEILDMDWAHHIKMDYAQNKAKKQLWEGLKKILHVHFHKMVFI